jgi:hypothetical protein
MVNNASGIVAEQSGNFYITDESSATIRMISADGNVYALAGSGKFKEDLMTDKLKILFVCTVNRMRSATAHKFFESDPRFEVDSAGTNKSASTVLEPEHLALEWADVVMVMEKSHRNFIRHQYP